MTGESNAARQRRGHEAFRNGDVDALTQLMAPDTVWHWPGNGSFGGTVTGRDAVLGMLQRWAEACDAMELTDEDFLDSGTRSASVTRMKLARGGRTLEAQAFEVVRWEDGRIAEEWLLVDDAAAYDAFWAD